MVSDLESTDEPPRWQQDQGYKDFLNWLTPIDHSQCQDSLVRGRNLEDYRWFLESTEFQTWLQDCGTTLFCPDEAGTGKTTLTAAVIDHIFSRFDSDPDVAIAYIYCDYERQGTDLAATLLRQLVKRSSLPPSETSKILYRLCIYHFRRPTPDEISATLQSVTLRYSRVFIIVDGPTECAGSECQSRLLSEIFSLRAMTGANFFATSRPDRKIELEFEGCTICRLRPPDKDARSGLSMLPRNRPNMDEKLVTKNKRSVFSK
ncbi:hypothetical protein BDW59DRAFT_156526 [Aspergillus cavernicola]|uniref:Nephrocystin 3-like N-terminal domain-containing protein n=1 Tax=Aspergillus cavernicola TaxID=176166 RepID=A0ABR4J116_9EURO